MNITSFVVQGRDQALLYGDYSTYHSQLAKRLLNARKKLGISTRNRGKFHKKGGLTPQEIGENQEYVQLQLLTSERAWAQAMSFKSSRAADRKGLTGRTRSHIVSRLDKAARTAEDLVNLLSDDASNAKSTDVLEAKAYAGLIRGAMQFEKHIWEPCLRSYSVARVIYSALASAVKGDIFKDLLSETIDPSIRYAAYQLQTPRTIPIAAIARKAFPDSDTALVKQINTLDPTALKQREADAQTGTPGADSIPKTLSWRSREVQIEDAQIATAWASVLAAKAQLADNLAKTDAQDPFEIAGAYDAILTATQDAVDATKQAIDDLKGERVDQSDPRMQSLQITRTAVNFEMISWRIGRNRVLTGPHDGATEDYSIRRRKKKSKTEESTDSQDKELPKGKKMVKLREKAALYDGTLQNLESILELPGVAADETLATDLNAFKNYFSALKCLAIGRSHALMGRPANTLALVNHALQVSQEAAKKAARSSSDGSDRVALNVQVTSQETEFLVNLLNGELQRHRAIVHIDRLREEERKKKQASGAQAPLVERLHEYPAGGVDLKSVVEFPPNLAPIPMKPIFLDVAWNYIGYPGKTVSESQQASAPQEEQPQQQPKRGWFGFGRS